MCYIEDDMSDSVEFYCDSKGIQTLVTILRTQRESSDSLRSFRRLSLSDLSIIATFQYNDDAFHAMHTAKQKLESINFTFKTNLLNGRNLDLDWNYTFNMSTVSQTIRTSKYTTTIDIPAEKLQTRAKFIQIPTHPEPSTITETFTIPGHDCCQRSQKSASSAETRLIIEELEGAYNEDMERYETKIAEMERKYEARSLQQQAEIKALRENRESERQQAIQAKTQFERQIEERNRSATMSEEHIKKMKTECEKNIRALEAIIEELKREKQEISRVKIEQFVHEQQTQSNVRINLLETELKGGSDENQRLKGEIQAKEVDYNNLAIKLTFSTEALKELEDSHRKGIEERSFQSKELDDYITQVKKLEEHKEHLNKVVFQKDRDIENLVIEMKEQTACIEGLRLALNEKAALHDEHPNQLHSLTSKVIDLEDLNQKKESIALQSEAKYLLKLKEVEDLRGQLKLKDVKLEDLLSVAARFEKEKTDLVLQNEKLGIELSKQLLQYNELLAAPPQEKVYEVKIEKSVDRKQYIEELEEKVKSLEKIVEELREGNESYVEEIKKRLQVQRNMKRREDELEKSVCDLRDLIERKQNSISWVVQREIEKDIQLSREVQMESKSQQQNYQGSSSYEQIKSEQSYKVKVRTINNASSDLSGIKKDEKGNKVNISIESNVERILEQGGSQVAGRSD